MAKKKRGFLYKCGDTIVLCTGEGKERQGYKTFAGTVVSGAEAFWGQGDHSKTWSSKAFKEYDKAVNLRSVEL